MGLKWLCVRISTPTEIHGSLHSSIDLFVFVLLFLRIFASPIDARV